MLLASPQPSSGKGALDVVLIVPHSLDCFSLLLGLIAPAANRTKPEFLNQASWLPWSTPFLFSFSLTLLSLSAQLAFSLSRGQWGCLCHCHWFSLIQFIHIWLSTYRGHTLFFRHALPGRTGSLHRQIRYQEELMSSPLQKRGRWVSFHSKDG